MGRRGISERYVRATGWVWIAVFACAAFAALFAVLVKTNPNEGMKSGEILQAVASLAGSALGILGAFMLARWSLGETERERRAHRADLAVLASNAILDLISYYNDLQSAIEALDRTPEAIAQFGAEYDKFAKGTLAPSPVLRNELVASFPVLENCLYAIEDGDKRFVNNIRFCRNLANVESRVDDFNISYTNCIANLVQISSFMEFLGERCAEATKLDRGKDLFEDSRKLVTAFKTSVYELAKRTAPDIPLK